MAYDERLAARVGKILAGQKAVGERKMFGGICFTLRGNMCCGVLNDDLILRIPPDDNDKALKEPHVRPFDFTGRPMKGYIYVAAAGLKTEPVLKRWLKVSIYHALTLPPKA
jgi:TfoX/Sxy family transcriptional regulator of competence genes